MKHLLVFGTVLITVISSLILDFAADKWQEFSLIVLIVIGSAFLINVFKFILWGQIHKNFDVSASYPLTSIFFPIIYFIGYLQGDSEFSLQKIYGIVLIMIGLILFEKKAKYSD